MLPLLQKKKFKPFISKNLTEILHQLNIPVLLVENFYSWSEVTSAINQIIYNKQLEKFRENEQFHKTLLQLLANRNGLSDLCSTVLNLTDLSVAIVSTNFKLIDASYDFEWKKIFSNFQKNKLTSNYLLGYNLNHHPIYGMVYQTKKNQSCFYFFPTFEKGKLTCYIVLRFIEKTDFSMALFAQIESIQSVYLLQTTIFKEIKRNNLHYRNLIFEELLTEDNQTIKNKKNSYSLSLGVNIEQKYHLLLLSTPNIADQTSVIDKEYFFTNVREALEKATFMNEGILTFVKDSYLIILYGESQNNLDDFVQALLAFFNDFLKYKTFHIGVSASHVYWKLNEAWKEGLQANLFIQKNASQSHVQFYEKLGILEMFTDTDTKINHFIVEKLIDKYITPLENYDSANHTELLETLRYYFANDLSHNKTAQALFIHKNTLRARLKKIETILSFDLNRTDNLMNMNLAIHVYQAICKNTLPS